MRQRRRGLSRFADRYDMGRRHYRLKEGRTKLYSSSFQYRTTDVDLLLEIMHAAASQTVRWKAQKHV